MSCYYSSYEQDRKREDDKQELLSAFNKLVAKFDTLTQEVCQLRTELAPKTLDKPANPFPLEK